MGVCGKMAGMSPTSRSARAQNVSPGPVSSSPGDADRSDGRCSALSSSGRRCRRKARPGLTVCELHGGGTSASIRRSRQARAIDESTAIWDIPTDASPVLVGEELSKLINAKMSDVRALRIRLGENANTHLGMAQRSITEVQGTPGEGGQITIHSSRIDLVAELHRCERELLQMLRLAHEVNPSGASSSDVERIRLQTARETARLMKAYPGLGVDEAAKEVARRAQ